MFFPSEVDPLVSLFADRRHLSLMSVVFMFSSVEAIPDVEIRAIMKCELSSRAVRKA